MAPRRAVHNQPDKKNTDDRPTKRQRKTKSTTVTRPTRITEQYAEADPLKTAGQPTELEQPAATKENGNTKEHDTESSPRQEPKIKAHRLFQTREIVDLIAEALRQVDHFRRDIHTRPEEPMPASIALDQNITLKNFRLVSRMFAAAGARQLFGTLEISQTEGQRRLVADPPGRERNHPAEKIRYLKSFSLRPEAEFVRSLYIDSFRCAVSAGPHGMVPFLERGLPPNDRLRRDNKDPSNMAGSWLVRTLKQFPNTRHVCLMGDERRDFGLLIDAIVNAGLTILNLELDPEFPIIYHGPECLESASMDSIMANVRLLHLPKMIRYVPISGHPIHDESCRRMYRAVKTQFNNAQKLKHLKIGNWLYNGNSSIRDLPLKYLPCLATLHLKSVQVSYKALAGFLRHSNRTLKDFDLRSVNLTSGYWAGVFETLSPILSNLTAFGAEALKYQPAGLHGRIPMPIGAPHSWWYDQFGPVETLNSNDRKALSALISNWPQFHRLKLLPDQQVGTFDMQDFHSYQCAVVPIVRCAGLRKDGSRCSRDTKVVYDEELGWIHKSGSIGLLETWLCHLHRDQAERFLVWPWEDGYVTVWP